MPTGIAAIEAHVLAWPAAQRLRLAERLVASVQDFATPDVAAAWEAELEQRIADVQSGCATGIPADEVMVQARQRLHEARRVPPPRRPRTRRVG